jgi:hypothetical protein
MARQALNPLSAKEPLKNLEVPRHTAGIVPDNLLHFLHPWRSDVPPFSMADKPLKMKNISKSPPDHYVRGYVFALIIVRLIHDDSPLSGLTRSFAPGE